MSVEWCNGSEPLKWTQLCVAYRAVPFLHMSFCSFHLVMNIQLCQNKHERHVFTYQRLHMSFCSGAVFMVYPVKRNTIFRPCACINSLEKAFSCFMTMSLSQVHTEMFSSVGIEELYWPAQKLFTNFGMNLNLNYEPSRSTLVAVLTDTLLFKWKLPLKSEGC